MPDRHLELPAHSDLEYYRKQAKHLQHAYETGDAAAQARVADVLGDRAAEHADTCCTCLPTARRFPVSGSARSSVCRAPQSTS